MNIVFSGANAEAQKKNKIRMEENKIKKAAKYLLRLSASAFN
jgi:hypothetical protein